MQIIEQMLTGQLPMPEFTQALQKDQALRDTIRHFVPQEAKKDPHHPFWNRITYSVLEQYNFDYLAFVLALTRFDGTIGDALNILKIHISITILKLCAQRNTMKHTAYTLMQSDRFMKGLR